MIYKFLNSDEKMVKVTLKSYKEATQYANENNLICLAMDYQNFLNSFNNKIEKFKEHPKYKSLKEMADRAIVLNSSCGFEAIKANDFMERIITLPTYYIKEWLNGNNQLEWLSEYK